MSGDFLNFFFNFFFLVGFTTAEPDQSRRPTIYGSFIPSKSLLCKVELRYRRP